MGMVYDEFRDEEWYKSRWEAERLIRLIDRAFDDMVAKGEAGTPNCEALGIMVSRSTKWNAYSISYRSEMAKQLEEKYGK
jgi:hypothetical protein